MTYSVLTRPSFHPHRNTRSDAPPDALFAWHVGRVLAFAALLLCFLGAAQAESADATDAAFAALLAMPGVQPRDGGWTIPEQAEPAPTSEKMLMARLARLKKEGANFNAIRHRGTLLAHAIRAGKERTALWLLPNGADPHHVLFSGDSNAYDLALQYKRAAVARVLEDQYGFKPPAPKPMANPAATAAATAATGATGVNAPGASAAPLAPQSRIVQATRLMDRLLQSPYPSDAAQSEWRTFSATLSPQEYVAVFKDGAHLEALVRLVRNAEGGLEDALSRLPRELVRKKAQEIADLLAEYSYVSYAEKPRISYNATARSWPALWSRIDQPLLRYDVRPDLAGHVPPAQWPALFASGYGRHDAEVTGCLLSAVDVAAFRLLWPDFQRFFADARDAAPALVLGSYRLDRERSPCYYGSSPADTVAKLDLLRKQGVTAPVAGLRKSLLDAAGDPSLLAMVAAFSPAVDATAPRLVQVSPACDLQFNGVWLDALVKGGGVGWGVPADYVQAIAIPGQRACGLVVSGDRYADRSETSDDFFEGPFREGSTRCADLPDDGSIWVEEAAQVRSLPIHGDRCEGGCTLRTVRDTKTGQQYVLNAGKRGAMCSVSWQLPDAYEWQASPKGSTLAPSRDGALVDRLLRAQCQELPDSQDLECRGMGTLGETASEPIGDGEEVYSSLRKGRVVPIQRLVDQIGNDRKVNYAAAIAAHDNAQVRSLLAKGIPPAWTAAEIQALGKADVSIEEKRRRIALLFANPDQLDRTLNKDRYGLPETLLAWLPYQDWKPVFRVIARDPDIWRDAAMRLRESAEKAHRSDLACAIDRAQGFLCGGGIVFD